MILDYSSDAELDISAIFALEDIIIRLKAQGIKTLLVLNSDTIFKQLAEHQIVSQIGEKHVFFKELEAINYAKNCLKRSAKTK